MHPDPTQSPSLCICPLPLHPPPPKQNRKQKSRCESCSVSQCVTQYTLWSTQLCLQIFVAVSHRAGSASAILPVLDPYLDSSQDIPLLPYVMR